MADILTEEEINSILDNIGGMDTIQSILKTNKMYLRDGETMDKIPTKFELLIIQGIHEDFASSFGKYLTSRLKSSVELCVTSIDTLYWDEYNNSIPYPSYLYFFQLRPQDEISAVLELSSPLSIKLSNKMLGGISETVWRSRILTQAEKIVMKEVCDIALIELQLAWRNYFMNGYEENSDTKILIDQLRSAWECAVENINFKSDRVESDPDLLYFQNSKSTKCIVVTLEVMIFNKPHILNFCYPLSVIELVKGMSLKSKEMKNEKKNVRKEEGEK